ncbi:unnamed protein product [Cochlearia groenlandica]
MSPFVNNHLSVPCMKALTALQTNLKTLLTALQTNLQPRTMLEDDVAEKDGEITAIFRRERRKEVKRYVCVSHNSRFEGRKDGLDKDATDAKSKDQEKPRES